jgi:hypothetical protein
MTIPISRRKRLVSNSSLPFSASGYSTGAIGTPVAPSELALGPLPVLIPLSTVLMFGSGITNTASYAANDAVPGWTGINPAPVSQPSVWEKIFPAGSASGELVWGGGVGNVWDIIGAIAVFNTKKFNILQLVTTLPTLASGANTYSFPSNIQRGSMILMALNAVSPGALVLSGVQDGTGTKFTQLTQHTNPIDAFLRFHQIWVYICRTVGGTKDVDLFVTGTPNSGVPWLAEVQIL